MAVGSSNAFLEVLFESESTNIFTEKKIKAFSLWIDKHMLEDELKYVLCVVNKRFCSSRFWNLGISFLSLRLAADTALKFLQAICTKILTVLQ